MSDRSRERVLQGPKTVNCEECGSTKHVCPLCDRPYEEMKSLKNGSWAASPVSTENPHMLCARWAGERLEIYLHTEEQYE
jgi:hypothetical protein